MKKIFICLLLPFLCCVLFITSCGKKDRLSADTMLVSIEPATIGSIDKGASKNLSAVIRNSKGDIIKPDSDVLWSVSDESLGEFSSRNSAETIFVAMESGDGEIILTYCGIERRVSIHIN